MAQASSLSDNVALELMDVGIDQMALNCLSSAP